MKKKVALTLGLLGVIAVSMLGSSAFAHDRDDYRRDGWRDNRNHWSQNHRHNNWDRKDYRRYRKAVRANWRHNDRVSYRPGNRWGNYRNEPRRTGWFW